MINIGKMMKDVQKAQAKLQEDLEKLELEGSAGGGIVTARMNGKKELIALKLAPEATASGDRELLEDLILAAVNEAGRRVDAEVQSLTQGLTAGLKIPGLPI